MLTKEIYQSGSLGIISNLYIYIYIINLTTRFYHGREASESRHRITKGNQRIGSASDKATPELQPPLLKFLSNFFPRNGGMREYRGWHVSSNPPNISTRAIFLLPPPPPFNRGLIPPNKRGLSLSLSPPPSRSGIPFLFLSLPLILVGTTAACY